MRLNYAKEITASVTMREVMDRYGIAVNRSGFAVCPFHAEKTASLKVYPGSGGFHCFGCGAHGSVIDFTMQYFELKFNAACERLNDDFGLLLPMSGTTLRERQRAKETARKRRIKRIKEESLKTAVYENREEALDIWCACDFILMNFPIMSDEWCSVLKNISAAAYNLDCAEEEVAEFEHKHSGNSDPLLVKRRLSGN